MNVRKLLAAGGLIGVSFLGGVFGATLLGTANAATTTPTPTPSAGSSASANPAPSNSAPANTGTFHSNEDPTHEAGESAAREAAEDNGTAGYGPQGG
jgi:hypothetical protein